MTRPAGPVRTGPHDCAITTVRGLTFPGDAGAGGRRPTSAGLVPAPSSPARGHHPTSRLMKRPSPGGEGADAAAQK